MTVRVTVWTEGGADVYPEGMHVAIADGLRERGFEVRTAALPEPEHGLGGDVLDATDVLFWWGHSHHDEVSDAVAGLVRDRVYEGMGLVVLHSGMESKVFRGLMGTSAGIAGWRHDDHEVLWTVAPDHPIAAGVPRPLVIPGQEMYAEPFDVPQPDEVVFISSFSRGEVFRSGITYRRGRGKVFYFSPGHETCEVFTLPDVRNILANAASWAAR